MTIDLQLTYVTGPDGAKVLTIPDEQRALVIEFLRDSGTKTALDVESIVQEAHEKLSAALIGVTEAQATFKPSAGDWSILELMAHVVTVKRVMSVLARTLAAGQLPPGFGPQFEEAKAQDGVTSVQFASLAEARAAAGVAHGDLLAFIHDGYEIAATQLTFRHFVFGALNAREWAAFQVIHDDDHTPQIGAIKASAGYPAR